MSEHYYSKNPKVKSKPKEWSAELRGKTLRFKTDAGVFSKGEVDFGSRLLAETFVYLKQKGIFLILVVDMVQLVCRLPHRFRNEAVHMVDVNERALTLAAHNAKQNDIQMRNLSE